MPRPISRAGHGARLREIQKRHRDLAAAVQELDLTTDLIRSAIERRLDVSRATELTRTLLEKEGLDDLERDLLKPLVSKPRSGEMVKGHSIVLAELGLCGFEGQVVRDPHLFDGPRSKEARTEHILWRMALTQEIWSHAGGPTVYRVVSSDTAIAPVSPCLVSATFSSAVAESHLGAGGGLRIAKLCAQRFLWRAYS